jgi:hypothetical protein
MKTLDNKKMINNPSTFPSKPLLHNDSSAFQIHSDTDYSPNRDLSKRASMPNV